MRVGSYVKRSPIRLISSTYWPINQLDPRRNCKWSTDAGWELAAEYQQSGNFLSREGSSACLRWMPRNIYWNPASNSVSNYNIYNLPPRIVYLWSIFSKISSFLVTPQYLCCKWQLCVSFEWNIECRVTVGCVTISTPTCVWKVRAWKGQFKKFKDFMSSKKGDHSSSSCLVSLLFSCLSTGCPKKWSRSIWYNHNRAEYQ